MRNLAYITVENYSWTSQNVNIWKGWNQIPTLVSSILFFFFFEFLDALCYDVPNMWSCGANHCNL